MTQPTTTPTDLAARVTALEDALSGFIGRVRLVEDDLRLPSARRKWQSNARHSAALLGARLEAQSALDGGDQR